MSASHHKPLTDPSAEPDPSYLLGRDDLFPPHIAANNGLDPHNFAILQLCDQSNLYDFFTAYAAHFAVDIDDPLPLLPPSKNPQPDKQNNSTTHPVHASSSDQHPSPDPDHVLNNGNEADDERTAVHNDQHDRDEGEDSDDDSNQNKYENDQVPSYKNQTKEQLRERFVRETDNGNLIARREGSGKISSILYNMRDDYEWSDSSSLDNDDKKDRNNSDSDTISDTDSDTSSSSSDWNDHRGIGIQSYGLRRLTSQRVHRFRLGVGYSKMRVGTSSVVYLHHLAIRDAFQRTWDRPDMMLTLAIAGQSADELKEACAVVQRWYQRRMDAVKNCGNKYFTLYRFCLKQDGSGRWSKQASKRSRPASSIILKDGMLKEILNDVKDFVSKDTKAWYVKHGLPHRRSILFYGPPGCGKTSTIKMLAGTFGLNACFLSFTKPEFCNQSLHDAISELPARPLLVLEDVDVLFNEDRKNDSVGSVTFSGLLNALDGLVSVDGIITLFTTNHLDKLDSSLIRGGRVDRRFEFEHPNKKHLVRLFQSFYPKADEELAGTFADVVLNRPEPESRSIATLQQHFIYTRKVDAKTSVEKIGEFFQKFYPGADKPRSSLYI